MVQVGDKFFVVSKEDYRPMDPKYVDVTKVGRKYFYLKGLDAVFCLEDKVEVKNEYGATYKLYEKEEDYRLEVYSTHLKAAVESRIRNSYMTECKINLDQYERIAEVLNIEVER